MRKGNTGIHSSVEDANRTRPVRRRGEERVVRLRQKSNGDVIVEM